MAITSNTYFRFLFEQSGTFKNVARSMGFKASDYDICDDFGETDFKLDLFSEIKAAYSGKPSIFDDFGKEDFVFAFFPCVRFSTQAHMLLNCTAYQHINSPIQEKCRLSMAYHRELHNLLDLLNMLVCVCVERGLPLVVENPYRDNYLLRYWVASPSIVVLDRRVYGDVFEKPTAFWFFGCVPLSNVLFWPSVRYPKLKITEEHGFVRSRISKYFAANFLAQHVLPIEFTSDVDPCLFMGKVDYVHGL